ncbi:MAG: ATP-grasp domain-containing protein [Ruminococcaceae bacterium]|nr:ATP-grasp domain-containing protein [Oscillospiraceae bacterium]
MKKLYIICDYREKFPSLTVGNKTYNDHISKQSMINLINTINSIGYEAEYFGGVEDLIKSYSQKRIMPEGVYINLNDGLSEKHKRGQTPMLLEMLNVPYSGSDPFHTLLVSDKYFTNLCLRQKNIQCPDSVMISSQEDFSQIHNLRFPVIAKPNCEGSSIGITSSCFCPDFKTAKIKTQDLLKDFDEVLVQEYIAGYEITDLIIRQKGTNNILFNQPLSIAYQNQLFLSNEIFGIFEKSSNIRKYYLAEQNFSNTVTDNVKIITEQIALALNLNNFIRVDYRINDNGIFFIEANTNPAFGTTSDVGKCCELLNVTFESFVKLYIESLNLL